MWQKVGEDMKAENGRQAELDELEKELKVITPDTKELESQMTAEEMTVIRSELSLEEMPVIPKRRGKKKS